MDKDLKTFTEDETSRESLKESMLYPEVLDALEKGEVKFDTSYGGKEIEDDDEQKQDEETPESADSHDKADSHDNSDDKSQETNTLNNLMETLTEGQSDAPLSIGNEDPFEYENNRAEEDLLESIRRQWPTEKLYPKPPFTCSGLIALALKNSVSGSLPVTEIYRFLYEHFPWFRQAPKGWKNAIRMNLSNNRSNSWFEKIEVPIPAGSSRRRSMCWWELKDTKVRKLEEEFERLRTTDLEGIKNSMQHPDLLDTIQNGDLKLDPDKNAHLERSKYSQSPEKNTENLPQTSKSDSPPPISLQKIFESQAIRAILENLSKLSDDGKDIVEEENENESEKEKDKDENKEETNNEENTSEGKATKDSTKINENEGKDNENEGKNNENFEEDENNKNVKNNSQSINVIREENDDVNDNSNNEASIQDDHSGITNQLQNSEVLKDADENNESEGIKDNDNKNDYIKKDDLINKKKESCSNNSQSPTHLKSESTNNHSEDQNNEDSQDNEVIESNTVFPVIRWKPYKEDNRRKTSEDREIEMPVKRYSRIEPEWGTTEVVPPKPPYTCSCLIGLALKNSAKGKLPVYAIYRFMQEHYPYYRYARTNWKILVRRQLSANKWFIKSRENVHLGSSKRGITLWTVDPIKERRMKRQLKIWLLKERDEIKKSMLHPDTLLALHRGELKFDHDYTEEDIPDWAIRKEDVSPSHDNISDIDNIAESEQGYVEKDDDYDDHFIELNNAEADIDVTDEPIITGDQNLLSQNMGAIEKKDRKKEMNTSIDDYRVGVNGESVKKKNFKCEICLRMFSSRIYLEIHMRTHTGETPYSCDYCSRKFIRKSGLTRHMNICKQNGSDSVNESEIGTNERSDSHMDIKDDILILDKEKEISNNTVITDLIWKSGSTSIMHNFIEEHSGEAKQYECPHCDRKFKKQQYLTAHIQVHQAGKPYECAHCPRKFSLNKHLTYHMKVHSLEEKYIKTYQSSPNDSETSQTCSPKKSQKEDDSDEGIKQRVAEILKAVVSTAVTGKDLSENEKISNEETKTSFVTAYSNLKVVGNSNKKEDYSVDDAVSSVKNNKTTLERSEELDLSPVHNKFDEDVVMEEVKTDQQNVLNDNSKNIIPEKIENPQTDDERETDFPALRIESAYHNPNEIFQSDDEMEAEESIKSPNVGTPSNEKEEKCIKTSEVLTKNTSKSKSSDISNVETTAQKENSLPGSAKAGPSSSSLSKTSTTTIAKWTKWTPVDNLDTLDADADDLDNLDVDPLAGMQMDSQPKNTDPNDVVKSNNTSNTKKVSTEKNSDDFSDITIEQNTENLLVIQPDNFNNSLELVDFDDPLFSGVFDKSSYKRIYQNNTKTFQCQYCDKHYSDSDSLSKHLKLHSDKREFGCPECELRFETRDGLTGHKRVHESEYQYRCSYCDYSSYRSHNTKKHMTTCRKKTDVQ